MSLSLAAHLRAQSISPGSVKNELPSSVLSLAAETLINDYLMQKFLWFVKRKSDDNRERNAGRRCEQTNFH
jgi:hypothetical protein